MTATATPSVPAEAPAQGALGRAEGVELLGEVHGSGYKEGAALVRRADGQMVQLGPLMYALLECVDGERSVAELSSCLSESVGKQFDEEHVMALAQKLAAQGLLAGTEQNAPEKANPLLALRWKVLVTNPAVTKRLTAPFTLLFKPWVMAPVLACFLAVMWFVLVHKGVASATSQAFHKPELLLLIFVLAIASAGFHELGHASACRYGGATPAGMGMGIYMVWPAFYTDVTDAYRLPKRARLRTDLGGLYFNAIISVLTMGAWLLWHVDALLLLVAVQLIEMVKQLSPVIRADGYHILSDATGVPDLYAHIGPTLKRLLPWKEKEPTALKGGARALVTVWVLVVVPVLLSMAIGAILLLPRLLTTAWESGDQIISAIPYEVSHGKVIDLLMAALRLLALVLPLVGSVLLTRRILTSLAGAAKTWSAGSPARRAIVVAVAAAAFCGSAWALWPTGQYQPVRPTDRGTLVSFVAAPAAAARPVAAPAPVQLAPGTHLAVSMIPVGGATKTHPAYFMIAGAHGKPAVMIVSDSATTQETSVPAADPATTTDATTTTPTPTTTPATTTTDGGASAPTPVAASAFTFRLPSKPGPGDSQALAVNHQDGGVTYDIAYSLVTVKDGASVANTNSAFAFANCKACTTVAVSFQIVLVIGQSNTIAPVNAAGALNVDCPACITTAIADQIVVTLKSQPTQELLDKLQAALQKLNALPALGADGTPAAIAATVGAVQKEIDDELSASGLLTSTPATSTTPATTTTTATTTATTTTTTTTTAPTATSEAPPATTTTETTTTTQASTTPTTTTTPAATTTSETTTTETTTTTTGTTTTTSTTPSSG